MQEVLRTLQEKRKKLFLRLSNGDFAELLEVLHELEGSLAGAGAGGLVTLVHLEDSVLTEGSSLSIDFFQKCYCTISFIGL